VTAHRPPEVDRWVVLAVLGISAILGVALFGERLAPHESIYFVLEHGSDPRPYDPGLVFPLGSDILGRDLFSLVLAGARATLTIVVLGGIARVAAGVLLAALGNWWPATRLLTETVAELISAVPATLVALLLVRVFVRSDTTIAVFIAALLVIGWAGPYRVFRAEVDRLAQAPFTQGALAIGVSRWTLFWRHHLPHLVPALALNLSQQIVAALVLVAELGVLGVFVSPTRVINIEESLRIVVTGTLTLARIADVPEWGGLLANARTVESLWTTRWLILVPGAAFALTAALVAMIGFAVARRYARRNVLDDLRGTGASLAVVSLMALIVVSALVPTRYGAAEEWASAARTAVRSDEDAARAFADAGLRPLSSTYAVRREAVSVVQTAPSTAAVGDKTVIQEWPREPPRPPRSVIHVQPLVTAETGGGVVEAPLVFVGRGIVPSEYPPQPAVPFGRPDIGARIKDYADDYAGIDVRGKVVLLMRFLGVAARTPNAGLNGYAFGPSVDESINGAIKRGAAAVLFVDRDLPNYTDGVEDFVNGLTAGINPYLRLERSSPAARADGVPVVVLDGSTAQSLMAPHGIDLLPFLDFDESGGEQYRVSPARDLGVSARVDVPLERHVAVVTSYVGEVGDVPTESGRVLVWAVRSPGRPHPSADVVGALARTVGPRGVPFIFVDFDPAVDSRANAQSVAAVITGRRIVLVVVLDHLDGSALLFTTPYGDLIPALDFYADKSRARHEVTRTTAAIDALAGVAPLIETKTVLVSGNGGVGDLRPDAAAFLGYLAGRRALRAEELPQ
jgi:peptide/nickel transport system permease protein